MRTIIKNTILLATTLMILIITGGCNHERFPSHSPDGPKIFTIHGRTSDLTKSGSGITKTGYNTTDKDIYWEKGDSIGVFIYNNSANTNVLFKQSSFNSSSPYSCDFAGEFTSSIQGTDEKTIYAYYPYQNPYTNSSVNISSASLSGHVLTMNFPADQIYHGDGCFTHLPAVGKYEGPISDMNIRFKNMYTLIKLTLKADEISTGVYPKLMNIRFRSNTADMNVAGPMSIDMSESALVPNYSTLNKAEIVLSMGGADVTLNSTGKDFYIAVPSMEYKDGYTIIIQTDKGIDARNINHSSVIDLSAELNTILLTPAKTLDPKMWIEDVTFRSYLVENELITVNDLARSISLTTAGKARTKISVSTKSDVKSLQGIEYFTELAELNCDRTSITSLDVSNNTKLTYIYCYQTGITSLDVSKNTALKYLNCNLTSITSLDVSKNTALTHLYCSTNGITSLDVSKNTKLIYLRCNSTGITSLDVSKNTELSELACSNSPIEELNISNCKKLGSFWPFPDKETISSSDRKLDLSGGSESSLKRLIANNLGIFGGTSYHITSVECVGNTKIESLSFDGCLGISSITLTNNTALKSLSIVGSGPEEDGESVDVSASGNHSSFLITRVQQ